MILQVIFVMKEFAKDIWRNLWYHTGVEKATMLSSKWMEYDYETRWDFPIDRVFKRKILRIGPYTLFERIRVVQYPKDYGLWVPAKRDYYDDGNLVHLSYTKAFGMNDEFANRFGLFFYRILNVFSKHCEIKDVTTSKYMDKYPFVGNIFKDYTRNKKLEELGL